MESASLESETLRQDVVTHALNPKAWEAEAGGTEFPASLIYGAFPNQTELHRDPVSVFLKWRDLCLY